MYKHLRQFSSRPLLPKFSFIPSKYTGPSLEQLTATRKTKINPVITTNFSTPLVLNQGFKQWLFDINGKRYLDMFGGICTVSVGHCHPQITEALTTQARKLGHVSNIYYHENIHEYAERLTNKFPGNLKVVYFVNSGSEANDLAVLMARAYTKNYEILTLQNCYHGMTYQTMGLTSNTIYKYSVPQVSGVTNVMNPDVYRGLWGGSHCRDSPVQTTRKCPCPPKNCEAKEKYLQQFNEIFKYNMRKGSIAAFFAESIQGVGGTVQFPKGYIQAVYDVVKSNGGLFVADEVQTGFGRTGDHFWGFEGHGIIPDIVTLAKGIGNGFPLGAVVTTPEIAAALSKATHFNTFGGNPLACAVGITVLDIIKDEKLQENSLDVGTYLLNKLKNLQAKHASIGDVRGKGLMIGVEMVNSDGASLEGSRFVQMWDACRNLGLVLGRGGVDGNVIRIKPPMCITREDADFTVSVLDKAIIENI